MRHAPPPGRGPGWVPLAVALLLPARGGWSRSSPHPWVIAPCGALLALRPFGRGAQFPAPLQVLPLAVGGRLSRRRGWSRSSPHPLVLPPSRRTGAVRQRPVRRRVSVFLRGAVCLRRVSVFQGRGELRAQPEERERSNATASGNHLRRRWGTPRRSSGGRTARSAPAGGEVTAHREGRDTA
ncbi:hypothetical protein SBRY_60262 [Actinacidiphila bryophytorum]|uniref:Uncharacterized protein n=1 Tax=Actinacidiphila bryophytorum TaxID=1436133 RepID=A0A9W4MJ96_9ACTN|nr:hypothetical protein SBRY_60262 [Actinacidiphila bryophytorum]